MFCIIPEGGMPFRLSWQLVSIWIACIGVVAMLSSWWWKAFLILALFRTAANIPPAYDGYISLLMIAIFLAFAEGFSRIDKERTMDSMCIAALIVLDWMALQKFGIAPSWSGATAGIFNPDTASIFLAMCLPACFRGWRFSFFDFPFTYRMLALPAWRREWRYMIIPLIFGGLCMAWSTTGALAAFAALAVYIWIKFTDSRRFVIGICVLAILAGFWFWQVKPVHQLTDNVRWLAWKHAAWSLRSEAFGRGLGTWELVFPLLASGEPRLGIVTNEGGVMTMENVFSQAHNEPIQATFELGVQALALILAFMIAVFIRIYNRNVSVHEAMGMTALFISTLGFFCMHIAPTALLGCAWLGLWEQNKRHRRKMAASLPWTSGKSLESENRLWAI